MLVSMLQQFKQASLLSETSQTHGAAGKYDFSINAYQMHDAERVQIESFIKQGFQRVYGADISVTMPTLLAVRNASFKAALGIRSANEPLFVEQYLSTPIEHVLMTNGLSVAREHIAEIGHLYSNKSRFALPLLLTAGVSLFVNEYRYITFCATSHVRQLVHGAGIAVVDIGEADKATVSSMDNWGTYYDTLPRVVAVSTLDIMQSIIERPKFLEMFSSLSARIQCVSNKIAGQK